MNLLIVESPTKARKIGPMLGPGWRVEASVGHIRDLPEKTMGVDLQTFEPTYEITKPDVVKKLKAAAKEADVVYLGTDPDREGEAIAWHLEVVLGLRAPRRVEFHKITVDEVRDSIKRPRAINMNLVASQEARRILDRLVGYRASAAISDRTEARTAGRVQSVGVLLVVRREREIRNFVSRDYVSVDLGFAGGWKATWHFKPVLDARGIDDTIWTDEPFAQRVASVRDLVVRQSGDKQAFTKPPAAFTTSTLQKAGAATLRWRAEKTMEVAQKLFTGGHISYHRTDDPNMASEFVSAIRTWATANGLAIPDTPHTWKAKKSAQEAHEAIRPTDINVVDARSTTDPHKTPATDEEQRLYELIRKRAITAQLASEELSVRTLVLGSRDPIDGQEMTFVARGSTQVKPGFRAFSADDAAEERPEENAEPANPVPLPAKGEHLQAISGRVTPKKTTPPPLYTESTLIDALERQGIGRPSTYASIMATIRNRGYVEEDQKRKLRATPLGELKIDVMEGRFSFVDPGFTAALEEQNDLVESGQRRAVDVIRTFNTILDREIGAFATIDLPGIAVKEQIKCPTCPDGQLSKKSGKSGVFWACSGYRAGTCTAAFPDQSGKPDFTPRPKYDDSNDEECPSCRSGKLRRRENSRGAFYGCSGFSKGTCTAMYPDLNGKPDLNAQPKFSEVRPAAPARSAKGGPRRKSSRPRGRS